MVPEALGMGASRAAGLCCRLHDQESAGGGGGGGDTGDVEEDVCSEGRPTENEPSKIRQTGGHGRLNVPQRGFGAAQHQREILLWPDICK